MVEKSEKSYNLDCVSLLSKIVSQRKLIRAIIKLSLKLTWEIIVNDGIYLLIWPLINFLSHLEVAPEIYMIVLFATDLNKNILI